MKCLLGGDVRLKLLMEFDFTNQWKVFLMLNNLVVFKINISDWWQFTSPNYLKTKIFQLKFYYFLV